MRLFSVCVDGNPVVNENLGVRSHKRAVWYFFIKKGVILILKPTIRKNILCLSREVWYKIKR